MISNEASVCDQKMSTVGRESKRVKINVDEAIDVIEVN